MKKFLKLILCLTIICAMFYSCGWITISDKEDQSAITVPSPVVSTLESFPLSNEYDVTPSPEATTTSTMEQSPFEITDNFSYDKLQSFFIDLSPQITATELEHSIEQHGLYYCLDSDANNTRNATYTAYKIYDCEPKYTVGSYVGQQSGDVYQDYIVVVFDDNCQVLRYYLYLRSLSGPHSYHEILYYNSGKYGEIGSVLWRECMTDDVRGFYYHDRWYISSSLDDIHLTTHFRDDEDVPYYYRGKSYNTGFLKFQGPEDTMNYLLFLEKYVDGYEQ